MLFNQCIQYLYIRKFFKGNITVVFILLQLLNGKFSGTVTAATKSTCWDSLARELTAVSGVVRSGAEVKKKWSAIKSGAKSSVMAARRSMGQTGGGEMGEQVTASDQRVIAVMGKVCVDGVGGGVDVMEKKLTGTSHLC